jgi:hypothetical protein
MPITSSKTSTRRRLLAVSGFCGVLFIVFGVRAITSIGSGGTGVTIAYAVAATGFAVMAISFLFSSKGKHIERP